MTEIMVTRDGTSPWTTLFQIYPMMMKLFKETLDEDRETCREIMGRLDSAGREISAIVVTAQFGFVCTDILDHYQVPIIAMSPSGRYHRWTKMLGNPEHPAYMPDVVLPMVEPLSLQQRIISTIVHFLLDYNLHIRLWEENTRLLDFTGLQLGKWAKLVQTRVDIILQATHHVTHGPAVLAPNTIEIGGLHCREGRPLPPHLQTILDSHPEGVIFLSFGSSIRPSQMSPSQVSVFLETFARLNQTVIWKWDGEEMAGLPSNVVLQSWLPQQDLLAHPNLQVFVTHGGLLSLQESLYHSTPLVGIPLGNDQKPNMMRAERRGYAVMLDWTSLNTEDLLAAIQKAATDPEVRENMERAHRLFLDQAETPQSRAVWWIEFTMRNGGAQFLKPSSVSLSWFQYHLIDVIAFLLSLSLLSLLLLILCCSKIRKCFSRQETLKNKQD